MATLYKLTGEEIDVSPANGKTFTQRELQAYVGGYFEMGYTKTGKTMVFDEEGKVKRKLYNRKATALHRYDNQIVGDVVVGEASEFD